MLLVVSILRWMGSRPMCGWKVRSRIHVGSLAFGLIANIRALANNTPTSTNYNTFTSSGPKEEPPNGLRHAGGMG